MSVVEEAASLFGTTDTANDPFAATLADDANPPDLQTGSELFSGQNYDSAAGFFGSNTSTGFGDYATAVGATNGTTGYANPQGSGTVAHSSYDYAAAPAADSGVSSHVQQTYGGVVNGQQGGYSSYEPAQANHSVNGIYHNSGQYTNSYEPSQYSYNPAPAAYQPPAPTQGSTTYDAYAPTQPSPGSASHPTYDPYKPAQAYAPQNPQRPVDAPVQYAPPTGTTPQTSFTADVPPPLPSASAYRPKTRNAYDPPLPPPKPSKRTHAWQTQTSPSMQTSYALPNTGVQPILSPPPPPRTVVRQHTSPPTQSAVAPQYAANAYAQITPHVTTPPAPGPPSDHYDTLSSQKDVPSTNVYSPASSQWIQPSANHSVEPSTYKPSERSPPAGYAPFVAPSAPYSQPPNTVESNHSPVTQAVNELFHANDEANLAQLTTPPIENAAPQSDDAHRETSADFSSGADSKWMEAIRPRSALAESSSGAKPSSPPIPSYHPVSNGFGHSPPSRDLSPVRTKSPGSASVRSWASGKRQNLVVSPPPQPEESSQPAPSRSMYDPPIIPHTQRTRSPSVMSTRSFTGRNVYGQYAPSSASDSSAARDRSMSNASLLSVASSVRDPYAPSLYSHSRQQSMDETLHGPSLRPPSVDHSLTAPYGSQVLSAASRAPYAPSPSLLGTNDPLGRASARVPVVSFGFGGKLVTCFHGSSSLNTGFDVALSSRPSTDVHLRILHDVIPESAFNASSAQFPGPLFCDPGTPSTSIIGTGAAAQTKAKKARVIKYLEDRAEEISQGIGYLQHGDAEGKQAEAKQVLIKLLRIMVENDGRLSGSSQIDAAVRAALVPYISTTDVSTDGLKTAVSLGFPRVGDSHPGLADLPSASYPGLGSLSQDSSDATVAVHALRSSNLDRIHDLLIRGERRAAFQYAADEKLWAHAMVIASSVDKEAWKEVVSEFVRTELTSAPGVNGVDAKSSALNGRESLKVAYSLFAGQGAASVQELLPPKLLVNGLHSMQTLQPVQSLQPPQSQGPTITPMTPNFPKPVATGPIPLEILSRWPETASMMISSPLSSETSAALTALGDQLAANGWTEAAHSCYLLSPQTSPFGGVGVPSCRVHLISANPATVPNFWKDSDAILFSEIVEFALSLTPQTKGQEAFAGLPHLQAYRLIRATSLAEMGHDQLANRYCEAISQSVGRSSPYIHTVLVQQLKGLEERLVAAPHGDKSGSWITSKMAKPSLDKLGNWLEGRLTSFIAGEADSPLTEDPRARDRAIGGPFAHYSTISSATSSTIPSPQRSTTDLTEIPPTPPYRTGSAMALRSSAGAHVPINRSSSAMDYIRRKASPVPRVSSASATTATFPSAPSFPLHDSYLGLNGGTPKTNQIQSGSRMTELHLQEELSPETPSSSHTGWGWSASDSAVPTPTATSFIKTETTILASSEGFISLMDDPALALTPSPAPSSLGRTPSTSSDAGWDEEDDLGLSTSRKSKPSEKSDLQKSTPSTAETTKEEPAKSEERPDIKQTASGGWLSRLWRRGDTPAPIKANLGDQTTFYYDKDLKRWVNKNAGAEAAKPSPPPPPPRSQTTSPGTANSRVQHGPSPGPPPPARPATAIDLSEPPKKPPMRVRSNLVPVETASAPTTPAASTMSPLTPMAGPLTPGLNGPPSARLKAQTKRNIRNRYVDVFQQQGAA